MKQYLTKLLILVAFPALGWAAGNIKTQGDANNGSLTNLKSTDLLYVLQSPYGEGDDAYVSAANLSAIDDRPIYNAITDGGLNGDYQHDTARGTDDAALAKAWIEGGIAAGQRRFYFPAGKYRWDIGVTEAASKVITPDGDDIEIFGDGIGRTILVVPAFQEMYTDDHGLFHFGSWSKANRRLKFHNIEIRIGWHLGHAFDDGTARGWWIRPLPWRADEEVYDGQCLISTDLNYIIKYNIQTGGIEGSEFGKTADSEPDWSLAPTTETGSDGKVYNITVKAIITRPTSDTMTAGEFYRYTGSYSYADDGVIYCSETGVSAASEPAFPIFSNASSDGEPGSNGGHMRHKGISFDRHASDWEVYNCRFTGLIGYNDAGGAAIGNYAVTRTSGVPEEERSDDRQGRVYAKIYNNRFENFQWGVAIGGGAKAIRIENNLFSQTGGWMSGTGGFNVHVCYNQGAGTQFIGNRVQRHKGGTVYKLHLNVATYEGLGHVIANNEFIDFDWIGIDLAGSAPAASNPDFIDGVEMAQGITISNNVFRITKSVHDKYGLGTSGVQTAIMDQNGGRGMIATGNVFFDVTAVYAATGADYFSSAYSSVQFMNNYCTGVWRSPTQLWGPMTAIGNFFDLRWAARTSTALFEFKEHSKFIGNDVRAYGATIVDTAGIFNFTSGSSGVVTFANNNVEIVSAPDTAILIGGDPWNVRIKDNYFRFNDGSRLLWVNKTGTKNVLLEGNHVDVSAGTPAVSNYRGILYDSWEFRNNSGYFWTSTASVSPNSGRARPYWSSTDGGTTNGRTDLIGNLYHLVDQYGARATTAADIVGVAVNNQPTATGLGYHCIIQDEEGTEQIIQTTEAVTFHDWVILGATVGEIVPNGTTGSTTEPATGFVGRVIDVGTAGAGAGLALVRVIKWNR